MSKQTAVEWLEQEFIALQNYGLNELGLFEKAKKMEEEKQNKDFIKILKLFCDNQLKKKR
jgi:hypothetical protein